MMIRTTILAIIGIVVGATIGYLTTVRPAVPTDHSNQRVLQESTVQLKRGFTTEQWIVSVGDGLGDPSDWKSTLKAWRIIESMSPEQVRNAAEFLVKKVGRSREGDKVLRMFAERWAFLDPDGIIQRQLRRQGSQDPMAMLRLAGGIEHPRQRFLATKEWVRESASSSQVANYLANLARPSERKALTETWSKSIRIPDQPDQQMQYLQTIMGELTEAQQRPLRDAILTDFTPLNLALSADPRL